MKVIVTGGSRGIGEACVRKFVMRGDEVVFIYRTSHECANSLVNELGVIAIAADISNANEAYDAIKRAIDVLGGVDVLVNNAGVSHIGLFGDMSHNEIDLLISADLLGTMYASHAVIDDMVFQKSGYIINISSIWGVVGASCEVVYSAAKAGIIGFTKALAKELGPSNINVNCIAPGVIETDMNKCLDAQTLCELCNSASLGRIGKPYDIANAVCFLASDKASFITGEVLNINGGFIG